MLALALARQAGVTRLGVALFGPYGRRGGYSEPYFWKCRALVKICLSLRTPARGVAACRCSPDVRQKGHGGPPGFAC